MQFQTHFFKKEIHQWKDVPSPQHSIVLKAIPRGELVTLNTVVGNVMSDKDNDLIRKAGEVYSYLNDLVKGKYIAEVHGERLFKFLKDF